MALIKSMISFNRVQAERLSLEKEIGYWAERYNKIQNPRLKELVIFKVRNIIDSYASQILAKDYHLDRYERIKKLYSRK